MFLFFFQMAFLSEKGQNEKCSPLTDNRGGRSSPPIIEKKKTPRKGQKKGRPAPSPVYPLPTQGEGVSPASAFV